LGGPSGGLRNQDHRFLYPQVVAENYWPVNPQGCWDWWGFLYTGPDYATLSGKQIMAVAQMINTLVREDLLEVPPEHAGQTI
jgi:hypothetical protein